MSLFFKLHAKSRHIGVSLPDQFPKKTQLYTTFKVKRDTQGDDILSTSHGVSFTEVLEGLKIKNSMETTTKKKKWTKSVLFECSAFCVHTSLGYLIYKHRNLRAVTKSPSCVTT